MKNKTKIIHAVAFDMDGLIFDSERIYKIAWQNAAWDYSYNISDELYYQCTGLTIEACENLVVEKYGPRFPINEFGKNWRRRLHQLISAGELKIKDGFDELFNYLRRKKIPLAIATSSPRKDVDANFFNLNYKHQFSCIVAAEDVKFGKPDPEIYQLAAKKLNIKPAKMLVLEDSINGIKAALSAGAIPVMVPDLFPPDEFVKTNAFAIVDNLQSIINLPIDFVNK